VNDGRQRIVRFHQEGKVGLPEEVGQAAQVLAG
jgi:hypothetical protein